VLALFPFHAAQIYNEAPFYVKASAASPVIAGISDFIYQWHMPLFMFLAGMGSCYALRFRSGRQYALERFRRLFVPLLFGTLVLVPPATYVRMFGDPARVWHAGFGHNAIPGFDRSYPAYYPDFFNGIYPNGNFEWGHLWFLAYLLTFSLVGLPVFLYLKSTKGKWFVRWLQRVARKPGGILLFFLPIAVIEVALRGAYPNMQNLVSDWANVLMFFTVFLYGFVVASDEEVAAAIDRHWKAALAVGLLIAAGLAVFHAAQAQTGWNETAVYVVEMVLRGILIWFCQVGFLGLGRRFLNRGGRVIQYASKAALPVYIIHLPVVVIIGFYVLQVEAPPAAAYAALAVAALIASLALYEIAVRRWSAVRLLFGLKWRV
jgi:fucose 4-O-acetylase-like acetyltransferase